MSKSKKNRTNDDQTSSDMKTNSGTKNNTANLQKDKKHIDNI